MELFMEESGVRIYSTPCCRKCGNGMERISRTMGDHAFTKLSFGIVKVKRFLCFVCLAERKKFSI
ncbi:MAG: hypothetical protein ABI772_13865 [Bacteroidota bacterium]